MGQCLKISEGTFSQKKSPPNDRLLRRGGGKFWLARGRGGAMNINPGRVFFLYSIKLEVHIPPFVCILIENSTNTLGPFLMCVSLL